MTINELKNSIEEIANEFSLKRVVLFGSRADMTNREDSDVDLIVEFYSAVSLLTLSTIKVRLEEKLGLNVDVVHGPLKETDLIEVKQAVEIYAA